MTLVARNFKLVLVLIPSCSLLALWEWFFAVLFSFSG